MNYVSLPEAVGIAMISVPFYLIYRDFFHDKMKHTYCPQSHRPSEEHQLCSRIRSESARPGPAFVSSHVYHSRRTERTKDAYKTAYDLVNQNLQSGNRSFKIALTENDVKILNVVRKLLLEELAADGYDSEIGNPIFLQTDNEDSENNDQYYLEVTVQ